MSASPVIITVDPVHGNDRSGVRPDNDTYLLSPFLSLLYAKRAARQGDTIRVLPGTHTLTTTIIDGSTVVPNLAQDGINWHYEPGAVVMMTGTGVRSAIYNDGANGAGSACSYVVSGRGKFIYNATPASSGSITCSPLLVQNPNSVVSFEFEELECRTPGQAGDRVGFAIYAGSVVLRGRKTSSYGYDGGDVYGGDVTLHIDEMYGSYQGTAGAGEGLEISGGTVRGWVGYCHSDSTQNGGDAALLLTNTGDNDPNIDGLKIDYLKSPHHAIRVVGSLTGQTTKKSTLFAGVLAGDLSVEVGAEDTGAPTVSYTPRLTLDARRIEYAGTPIVTDGMYRWLELVNTHVVVLGAGNNPSASLGDTSRLTLRGGCSFIQSGTAKDIVQSAGTAQLRVYGFAGGTAGLGTGVGVTVGAYTTDADIAE